MRIGVDGRSLAGEGRGVAAYTDGMVRALAAAGAEMRVAAPSRLVRGLGAVAGRPRLDRLVGPVDVVWLPAPAPVAVGATPYAVTFHDLSFLERPADFTAYERLWHGLARPERLARRAARVIAVSGDTAARLRARFGVEAIVVPGGPGDPGPRCAPDARFGRYFLFVGALEPRKGLDALVTAQAGLETVLVLAGEGRLANRLTRPGVHVVGRVTREDKAALFAGALAVVLPSWCEGYGYTPLEGYAHGTPAIVSDLPALRETAGAGALYVPPGDVPALAGAMRRLASDDALHARLAAGGAAALRERTWEASARALRAALEEAAAA